MANQYSADTKRNKAVVEAYASGMSSKQVAVIYSVSTSYVWELARNDGIVRRGYGKAKAVVSRAIKDRAIEMYQLGQTTLCIGNQLDISQATVGNILKGAGYNLTRKHLTEEGRIQIITLYQSGLNTYQVAEQSGFSNVTVGKVVRAAGVDIRPANVLTNEEQAQVLIDYDNGESSEQIAKRLGVSANTVRESIKRQGGTMRDIWPKKKIEPGQLFNPNYNIQDLPDCKFAGIYRFINLINGKYYIGQSINIYKRYYQHREMRAPGLFTKALRKYGIGNFKLEVLERVDDLGLLSSREQYWISYYQACRSENGYNLTGR